MLLKLMNAFGRGLWRCGYHPELTVRTVLQGAERSVKLDDFGDSDFIEPLEILISNFENESNLTPVGRAVVRRLLTTHAINRLLLQQAWKNHPECLDIEPASPLYVIGLPRTGTTLLYNLLCQDPQARPLMFWETSFPAPFPSEWHNGSSHFRRRQARNLVWAMNWAAPNLRQVHEVRHDAPEECGWLLNNTFVSQMFSLYGHIPDYVSKYWRQEPRESWRNIYNYYKKTLQLLQRGKTNKHWILKSPVHQGTISALLEVIPDARVVCTQRDPKQVIPSCCSLFRVTREIFSDKVDRSELGSEMLELLAVAAERADETSKDHSDRIFNVSYHSLIRNPIEAVRTVYSQYEMPFTAEFEDNMRSWLAQNPKHKHGVHKYSLEDFGLSSKQVDGRFEKYAARLEDSSQ